MDRNTDVKTEYDPTGFIAELDRALDFVPRRAIEWARENRETAVPYLIGGLQRTTDAIREGQEILGNVPYLSLLLLTELRAREALPTILEFFSLPDCEFDFLGDGLTEDTPRILAALADDQTDLLDTLAEDRSVNEYVRSAAQTALVMLVRDGKLTRDDVLDRLTRHLRHQIATPDPLAQWTVMTLIDLAPREVYDDIVQAFEVGLVEPFLINLEHIQEIIAEGDAGSRRRLQQLPESGFQDTIAEIAWLDKPVEPHWSELSSAHVQSNVETIVRDQLRVGRNDPCPCGSGRKFKKCCGSS